MKIEFELRGDKGWVLTSRDSDGSAESHHTSRKKSLLSIIHRIDLIKPSKHFRIIIEDISIAADGTSPPEQGGQEW